QEKRQEDLVLKHIQDQELFNQDIRSAIGSLISSILRIESHIIIGGKGMLPAQPLSNPKLQYEISDTSSLDQMEQAKSIT
ncbi:hypothetical protein PJP13_29825, partial [Mycobacterium kansasii]